MSPTTTTARLGSEEKQLLQFIDAYTPEKINIEPILKPFLLDYIPAVGDIDAFIKIPRPDEVIISGFEEEPVSWSIAPRSLYIDNINCRY